MYANSLKPVVCAFGTSTTTAFFEESIKILWQEVGYLGTSEDVHKVFEALTSLPESNEDDSNKPSYYAMRALAIMYYACEVWIVRDSDRAALDACLGTSELCSCFDFNLLDNPVRYYTSTSLESRQKGPLEARQISCQLKLLEVIQGTTQTEESMIEQAKTMANSFAGELERILPDIWRIHGWVRG
jgi:hypothetical protein